MDTIRNESMIKLALDAIDLVILRPWGYLTPHGT